MAMYPAKSTILESSNICGGLMSCINAGFVTTILIRKYGIAQLLDAITTG
jgi:hypothetical protein